MLRWLLLPLLVLSVHAQQYEGKTLVQASLIADTTAIVPGKSFSVGLLLEMAPSWHTYWEYGGDAGFPTTIAWTMPPGFGAGPIEWPLPWRVPEPGDIEVYAYKDRVLLLTRIVPPRELSDTSVTLRAKADWLVCAEICVPGSAELELTLPVAPSAEPAHREQFEAARSQLPSADPPPYELAWKPGADETALTITGLGNATAVDLFPLPGPDQQVGHPKSTAVENGTATVTIPASGPLRGVLVVDTPEGRKGWVVSSDMPTAAGGQPGSPAVPALPLWKALVFGLIGGLILNLMPCVLPVISLKIFGFVRQAGDRPERILRHGLAFFAGICAWFFALAAVIVALKAGGSEVTWAFQFQNPWFNVVIGSIVFVFALNLFGVYEIVLPGQASNALAEASGQEGYLGSFAQGVFATLLATPCTAPFLGSALGFAFSQSAAIIFLTFGAIALGMGLPYLILSARPGWMKILPRPGVWMERVKQFMGFPLIATLIWLLYILGNQKGLEGVIWFGSFLLCLAVGCWIYGAFCGPSTPAARRWVALFLAIAVSCAGGWFFLGVQFPAAVAGATSGGKSGGIAWQEFSPSALAKLRQDGQPVFVDFTADWCITCKVNERTSIDIPAVREVLRRDDIVPMKADWTNANPEITAALKEFGRVGVPFYVLYPAGGGEPVVLPEILTSQIVLDALSRAR